MIPVEERPLEVGCLVQFWEDEATRSIGVVTRLWTNGRYVSVDREDGRGPWVRETGRVARV